MSFYLANSPDSRVDPRRTIQVLLREAEDLLARDRPEEAFTMLEQAREMAGDDADVIRRCWQLESEIERRSGERDLSSVVPAIEEKLEQGELEAAGKSLKAAIAVFGEEPALVTLRQRLKASREDHETHEKLLFDTVIGLLDVQDDALASHIVEIRRQLKAGHPGEAMTRLNEAVQRFGDKPELQALRERVAEALFERDDEGDDTNALLGSEGNRPPSSVLSQAGVDVTLVENPATALTPMSMPSPVVTPPVVTPPAAVPAPMAASAPPDLVLRPGDEPEVPSPTAIQRRGMPSGFWAIVFLLALLCTFLGYVIAQKTGPSPEEKLEEHEVQGPAVPDPDLEDEDVREVGSRMSP